MSVVDFNEYLQTIIQAGSQVEGNVVKIIADNGREVGDAVYKVIQGGNGTAQEVAIGTQTAAGTTTAVATGMAFLTVDLGIAGAAIAPCLGVAAGYAIGKGIYSLDPEAWDEISDALFEAGETVGGKVIAYWNGSNIFFSDTTINIIKNYLVDHGFFTPAQYDLPEAQQSELFYPDIYSNVNIYNEQTSGTYKTPNGDWFYYFVHSSTDNIYTGVYMFNDNVNFHGIAFSPEPFTITYEEHGWETVTYNLTGNAVTRNGVTYYVAFTPTGHGTADLHTNSKASADTSVITNEHVWDIAHIMLEGTENPGNSSNLQPNAIYPDAEEFPLTYPDWIPWEFPQTLPDPSELPDVYPVKYPGTSPDPYPEQEPAQNPDPESAPDTVPYLIPDFDIPLPGIPDIPVPDPDPDPVPDDPEPIPTPDNPPLPSDPISPDPDPTPTPAIPVVNLPDTVSSSKLFTVYNPTITQLNALGAYLWDSSIMASLRDIWQDPLDGIISLIQVYATPTTSGSHNIILGFLNSGVSANVVSSQFVTIDCGSVSVPETKNNATDYAPYTTLHLYLPFIGIVELDTQECMNASIGVSYKVDVYTGTCLATVTVTRTADMPNSPILYTYSGNCSQQIPLTSGNATGVLSALIGGITAGLSVASGGGLGVLAGAQIAGQSLTHEMFHVSHSGNLSANAGIMGQKKPYLIIGRRHCYDANGYNTYYGYPSNKTVVLGNHTGFVKVKKCFLKTSATQAEHDLIMQILQDGIIL